LGHSPVLPAVDEEVTVSVQAEDPDGVALVTLWWRTDGGEWTSQSMDLGGDGLYKATIAGQSSGRIVQFYVSSWDTLGEPSEFPADGEDSYRYIEVGLES
jgi:hypothetical protein